MQESKLIGDVRKSYHAKKHIDSTYLPEIKGKDVFRFEFVPTGDFLSYGDWLAEAREPKYFQNPKVTVRKVLGTKLHGTFIREPMAIDQSLYILISPKNDTKQLKFILGILMSSIGAWYLRTKYAIYDTLYPWYTRKQLAAFPIKPHDDKPTRLKLAYLSQGILSFADGHAERVMGADLNSVFQRECLATNHLAVP